MIVWIECEKFFFGIILFKTENAIPFSYFFFFAFRFTLALLECNSYELVPFNIFAFFIMETNVIFTKKKFFCYSSFDSIRFENVERVGTSCTTQNWNILNLNLTRNFRHYKSKLKPLLQRRMFSCRMIVCSSSLRALLVQYENRYSSSTWTLFKIRIYFLSKSLYKTPKDDGNFLIQNLQSTVLWLWVYVFWLWCLMVSSVTLT